MRLVVGSPRTCATGRFSSGPEPRGTVRATRRFDGCSRILRGFYTPDVLGVYEGSTLRMFSESTRILHSGWSQSLRGFYTPDVHGDYEDPTVGALGRDAVDLGRERVGEGGGGVGVEITHGVFKLQVCIGN